MTRRAPWLLLALAALAPHPALGQPAAGIQWRHDYGAARKEAQEKGLPLVIDFGTQACYWCKKLDESTFRDARIIALMNGQFVPLKIDAEREPMLTQMLRIASYPTIVLASPDGRILGTMEGFQAADKLHDGLQRTLANLSPPDWINRELQNATRFASTGDYARAVPALRTVLEEPRARPHHPKAEKLLRELEDRANARVEEAKQFRQRGDLPEALEALTETMRLYPGLDASRTAAELLTTFVKSPEDREQYRSKRARDLLAQAKGFYKSKDYIPCLDRCDLLQAGYGDLPEGQEGGKLAADIKNNPEWLQGACDTLSDRLGGLYLHLADSLLKRGEPQRAEAYLQRVIQAFPGSRQAESAQIRLAQIQGSPRPAQVQSAGP